jgi:hypothetical protein
MARRLGAATKPERSFGTDRRCGAELRGSPKTRWRCTNTEFLKELRDVDFSTPSLLSASGVILIGLGIVGLMICALVAHPEMRSQ